MRLLSFSTLAVNLSGCLSLIIVFLSLLTHTAHTKLVPRIIGSDTVKDGEYNFTGFFRGEVVSIGFIRYCTAVLVGPDVVLTTVDCTYVDDKPIEPAHSNVSFSTSKEFSNDQENIYSVRKIIRNPLYDDFTKVNNIAVLLLNSSVPEDVATPVKIFTDEWFSDMDVIVTGFGITLVDDDTSYPYRIMKIDSKIGSASYCKAAFPQVDDNQFCTRGQEGKGVCYGDAAAPALVRTDSGSLGLIGLHVGRMKTAGNPSGDCAREGGSDFYNYVAYYLGFITDNGNLNEDKITIENKMVVNPDSTKDDESETSINDHNGSSDDDKGDDSDENTNDNNGVIQVFFNMYILAVVVLCSYFL